MALDGIVLSNVVYELNELLVGGRIDKVAQPEKDELIISVRNQRNLYKLLLSAQASFPRLHLTEVSKNNPMTAPTFCMMLRKHLNNGKVLKVSQYDLERIVEISIEHLNELGDLCEKVLVIEIMGRHSNIILKDPEGIILDSIKHVGSNMSSVREVLPGLPYHYPPGKDKISLSHSITLEELKNLLNKPMSIQSALYQSFMGFSPMLAEELCYLSQINSQLPAVEVSDTDFEKLYQNLLTVKKTVEMKSYAPYILSDENDQYVEFYSLPLTGYPIAKALPYTSVSKMLDDFYEKRANTSRVNQKSFDIRKLIQNNIERCAKKYDLQMMQLKDTEDREKFKIKGELINANLYQIKEGQEKVEVFNYYTNENEIITLDPNLTPSQNAVKLFNKYNKKKRTFLAVSEQLVETKNELEQLESIKFSLELAESDQDLVQIRNELVESGYIKFRKSKDKKAPQKSQPSHYVSDEGFHFYVGKNNLQNEELSMKFATGNDWWFHAKGIPGSHVIVKTEGKEMTDLAYEQAAALAAFYSKAGQSPKVEIDYTQKKNLKKPSGSAPGFVIYHTNYSMSSTPSLKGLTKIE